MKLKDIADLYAGVITSRVLVDEKEEVSSDLPIGVLVPKAIRNGRVDSELVAKELLKAPLGEKNMKFLTQEGDIVTKFSSPYESCIIDKVSAGLLVPSFCCRIAIKDTEVMDRMFLLAFLNTEVFQEQLNRICHGRTIALLRKSDLEEVIVPDMPLEEQRVIGQRYRAFLDFVETTDRVKALEQERMNAVFEGGI